MKKTRKQLTPEQIARREEKRAAVRAIAARIKAMTPEQRAQFAAQSPLRQLGQSLSAHNACMVIFQNPSATLVGGFGQWIKEGRAVIKGQHGYSIWVPIGPKSKDEDGTVHTDKQGFTLGTVFDIAQTAPIENAAT